MYDRRYIEPYQYTLDEDVENEEYVNCNVSKVKVFFKGYLIFKKTCCSKAERNELMAYYKNVFFGLESCLWFHIDKTRKK